MSRLLVSIFILNCTIFNCYKLSASNIENLTDFTVKSLQHNSSVSEFSNRNIDGGLGTCDTSLQKDIIDNNHRPLVTSYEFEEIADKVATDVTGQSLQENLLFRTFSHLPHAFFSSYNLAKRLFSSYTVRFYNNDDLVFSDNIKKTIHIVREAVAIIKSKIMNGKVNEINEAGNLISQIAFTDDLFDYKFNEIASLYMILLDSENDKFNRKIFLGFKKLYLKGKPSHAENILMKHFRCLASDLFVYSLGRKQETCQCYSDFSKKGSDITKSIAKINEDTEEMISGRLDDFFSQRGHEVNVNIDEMSHECNIQYQQLMVLIKGSKA